MPQSLLPLDVGYKLVPALCTAVGVRSEVAVTDRLARPDCFDAASTRRSRVQVEPWQLAKYLLFGILLALGVSSWHWLSNPEGHRSRASNTRAFS